METVISVPQSDVGKHLREVLPGGETTLDIERQVLGGDGEVLPGQSKKVTLSLIRRSLNNEAPPAPVKSAQPLRPCVLRCHPGSPITSRSSARQTPSSCRRRWRARCRPSSTRHPKRVSSW